MNLQDIEAFVAVAEAGSVNRAAARLNLTQPATTRRIQNFEAAIGGAQLFNRAVKPAALTSLGNHVLERCRRVLTAVAELEACTAKAADPAGHLKAGVAHGEAMIASGASRQDFHWIVAMASTDSIRREVFPIDGLSFFLMACATPRRVRVDGAVA